MDSQLQQLIRSKNKKESRLVIFMRKTCPYSKMCYSYLFTNVFKSNESLWARYATVIDFNDYENGDKLQALLANCCNGATTVPQVFINRVYLGDCAATTRIPVSQLQNRLSL